MKQFDKIMFYVCNQQVETKTDTIFVSIFDYIGYLHVSYMFVIDRSDRDLKEK